VLRIELVGEVAWMAVAIFDRKSFSVAVMPASLVPWALMLVAMLAKLAGLVLFVVMALESAVMQLTKTATIEALSAELPMMGYTFCLKCVFAICD
jgi:hypothetical protein